MNSKIERATEDDLPAIAELAGAIWRHHYPGIISHEQIDYMLNRMFDLEEMRRQINAGQAYDKLIRDRKLIGFAVHGPTSRENEYKLDKLYIHSTFRERGMGRRLMDHVADAARDAGARSLILSVNKKNTDAIAMYERCGFQIHDSVLNDIGSGFVMDDYVMARSI